MHNSTRLAGRGAIVSLEKRAASACQPTVNDELRRWGVPMHGAMFKSFQGATVFGRQGRSCPRRSGRRLEVAMWAQELLSSGERMSRRVRRRRDISLEIPVNEAHSMNEHGL